MVFGGVDEGLIWWGGTGGDLVFNGVGERLM